MSEKNPQIESARAAIWDGHYGKGLATPYVQAVDRELNTLQYRLAALERVAKAAFELWRMNRPIAWSQKEHLENPEINATSDAEKVLCRAVAEFIKEPPHAQH